MSLADSHPHAQGPGLIVGKAANSPATAAADLFVFLPTFDGGETRFGPCPFTPRGALLPVAGDTCLVAQDDEGGWWCLVWHPS